MEIIKIKSETLDSLLRIVQESKTNLSFVELNGFIQKVQKEHKELNENKEVEND